MQKNNLKRHCMIVHAYYPLGETRVQREAETLVKYGYEVDVICLRGKNQSPKDSFKDVNIYRLPIKRSARDGLVIHLFEYLLFFLLAMFKVSSLYWPRRYRTVQVHNLPDFLVFSAWMPKLFGARLILDLHDLMPEFYAARFGQSSDSLSARLIRLQERLSCRFADHVITVSHHWRETLVKRGVPPQKCSVVMNVADERIFHLPKDGSPPLSDDDEFRLIYHGTLVYRYGLDLAIQAIDQVRREIPNIHLVLLGYGFYIDQLIQMVEDLGLEDHVTIHSGLRPAEKLPEIIRAADVGIVPYRNDVFTDGLLPTKLMEYAALGLPSIAARTTAIENYFSDTMVEFFEPGNVDDLVRCILVLYKDPERLALLAQNSEKFNQRYNWTSIGAEYVALVERLGAR